MVVLFSQAGRRGFEPRLPLHLFNNLGHIAGLSVNAITALSSRSRGVGWRVLAAPRVVKESSDSGIELEQAAESVATANGPALGTLALAVLREKGRGEGCRCPGGSVQNDNVRCIRSTPGVTKSLRTE
jgi:hypothetical protein